MKNKTKNKSESHIEDERLGKTFEMVRTGRLYNVSAAFNFKGKRHLLLTSLLRASKTGNHSDITFNDSDEVFYLNFFEAN